MFFINVYLETCNKLEQNFIKYDFFINKYFVFGTEINKSGKIGLIFLILED